MTALVSPERATSASLTGAIGFLVLAIAVVMMVIAAPTQARQGTHNPVRHSAVQLTSSNPTTVYACQASPWAKEHVSAF